MKKLKILMTEEFEKWLKGQEKRNQILLKSRLDMLSLGHYGNHKRFDGLIELRWRNGLRVYSFMWGETVVITLYGGNKNGQQRDINKAKKIRNEILEGVRTVQE